MSKAGGSNRGLRVSKMGHLLAFCAWEDQKKWIVVGQVECASVSPVSDQPSGLDLRVVYR